MSGAFQTSREIFENPIWKNILEFRLFFLIYGKCVFAEEGYRVSDDLHLQRGEWCRSIRKLQEDLTYIENRQVKTYSTSSLHRATLSLVKAQRICTRKHDLGTVFTVVNYEQYQGFSNYKNGNLEQNLEQSENSVGTVLEQSGNNNKNVKKEKNVNKVKKEVIKTLYGEHVSLTDEQYKKLIDDLTEPDVTKLIDDINYWFVQQPLRIKNYKDHNLMIRKWHKNNLEKKLTVLKGGQANVASTESRGKSNFSQYPSSNQQPQKTAGQNESVRRGVGLNSEYDLDQFIRG